MQSAGKFCDCWISEDWTVSKVGEEENTLTHLTCEIMDHPVVEVDKTHLFVPNVHAEMEEGAVEGDKTLENAIGDELGDVEPYFVGEGIGGWHD